MNNRAGVTIRIWPNLFKQGLGFLFLVSFAIVGSTMAHASLISDLQAANRITTWQGNVGVPGGIPSNYTQCGSTIAAGASATTINAALAACGTNQYVQLSAGTYNLTNTINISNSNVALNGAGMGSTIINSTAGTAVFIGNNNWYNDWQNAANESARHVDWVGGFAQGSTTITVSSVGDLQVGEMIYMDMKNDSNVNYTGSCNGPVAGLYSSVSQPNIGADRWQYQMNRVTAIRGNTITLSEPVYMPNYQAGYTAGLDPQIWWYGSQPVVNSGAQNLTINANGAANSSTGITLQNMYGGWVNNVEVTNVRYGVTFSASDRSQMEDTYVHDTLGTTDTNAINNDVYLVQVIASSGLLLENNISSGGNWMMMGLSGSVIAYNYLQQANPSGSYSSGGLWFHGANPTMDLFEGNNAPGLWLQDCWGSSEYTTVLRNRFSGLDTVPGFTINANVQAIDVGYMHRYASVIGNVLGTVGYNTWYDDGPIGSVCHDGEYNAEGQYIAGYAPGSLSWVTDYTPVARVYSVGLYGDTCDATYDSLTRSTLVKAVNWVSATDGLPSGTTGGIVLDSYQESDLPNSLYLTSKPDFFGNLPWPAYDPTNSSNSTNSVTAFETAIPAGYRLVNGVDPSSTISYGDLNGAANGAVSIYDAELVAQFSVGAISLTPTQMQEAEVSSTSESKPTIHDAFLIAEYAVGMITKFPVQ